MPESRVIPVCQPGGSLWLRFTGNNDGAIVRRCYLMNRWLLSASILSLALVTGAVGILFATAFCPSFERPGATCHARVIHSQGSHSDTTHEMHGREVSHAVTFSRRATHTGREWADLLSQAYVSGKRAEQPLDTCSHCLSHSKGPQKTVALRQADTFRSFGVDEPEVLTEISGAFLTLREVNAREHSPPTSSTPLHVRLNIYRI